MADLSHGVQVQARYVNECAIAMCVYEHRRRLVSLSPVV